jgi:hypothetical protein
MTATQARVKALAEQVRREIAEHPGEYPPLSDEQVRAVAALLPRVRPAREDGDHDAA